MFINIRYYITVILDIQRQKVTLANTNRERRVQYQHPKGAPDVDMIFGSKLVMFKFFKV